MRLARDIFSINFLSSNFQLETIDFFTIPGKNIQSFFFLMWMPKFFTTIVSDIGRLLFHIST